MIDLRDRRPDEPEDFKASVSEARSKIEMIIDSGAVPKSEDFEPLWSRYKHLFAEAQHDAKCAYCETRFRAGYVGDVEHYRPRTEVREPRDRGDRDDTQGKQPGRRMHKATKPGYWWLAYSWSNFLYSCSKCNGWKMNSFPLRDERGEMVPGVEANEEPLLLNPFEADPTTHVHFNELGEIVGLTEEGTMTIDRCGLDRKSLNVERGQIAGQLLQDLNDLAGAFSSGNPMAARHALRRLHNACQESAPYAAMARAIVSQNGLSYEELAEAQAFGLLNA